MGTLYLVRHGQASAFTANYDVLSERGIEQSRKLGTAWARRKHEINAIYGGPKQRHLGTHEHLCAAAAEHDVDYPAHQVVEGLDEMDVSTLFAEAMRRVLPSCPTLPEQLAKGKLDDDAETALQHYKGVFRKQMELWAVGDSGLEGLEPFDAFATRVQSALHYVMRREGRGRKVALITSGGPIAIALRVTLGLSATKTIDMMWPTHNTSVTKLEYTASRLTLTGYNDVSHLDNPKLLTHL